MVYLNFKKSMFLWEKGNYSSIINYLATFNWKSLFYNNDINLSLSIFYSIIYNAINMYIPIFHTSKSNYPCWFSSNLRKLIKKKKIALNLYKTTKFASDYLFFSHLRSECKKFRKLDYQKYIKISENNIKINPKQFWTFFKQKKVNK